MEQLSQKLKHTSGRKQYSYLKAPLAVEWSNRYRQARSFLYGSGNTPQDFEKAYDLFMQKAIGGNALAMYDLGRMYVDGVGRAADAEQAPPPAGAISFVDSKLRRKIREKKIAMGHKADDHEPVMGV